MNVIGVDSVEINQSGFDLYCRPGPGEFEVIDLLRQIVSGIRSRNMGISRYLCYF